MLPIKMCVNGNSFLFFFERRKSTYDCAGICRKYKVDGVAFVRKSGNSYRYSLYNLDGSQASFCGNATMCLAKLLYDRRLVRGRTFFILTRSGRKRVCIYSRSTVALSLSPRMLKLGEQFYRSGMLLPDGESSQQKLQGFPVFVGNKHFVIFENGEDIDYQSVYKWLNPCNAFPDGVNVEFVKVHADRVTVKVFERGCGKTSACGSGAVAVAFASKTIGKGRKRIVFDGGEVKVYYQKRRIVIIAKPRYLSLNGENKRIDFGGVNDSKVGL